MIEQLISPTEEELDALTALWEASVRATHDFLAEEDLLFFRNVVRREALMAVDLYIVREGDGSPVALMGLNGQTVEMLFLEPQVRGKGLGRRMMTHAIGVCGAQRVNVNEQNTQAAGFYARLGFQVVSRDAGDPSGRPYPILHLALRPDPTRNHNPDTEPSCQHNPNPDTGPNP